MHVEIIESHASLRRLQHDWDAVYDADPDAQFFLSSTWFLNWLEKIDSRWLVLAARPAVGRPPVAFIPLLVQARSDETGSYNDLLMGGGHFASLGGFICLPDWDEAALAAFAQAILGIEWRTFRFDKISAGIGRQALFLRHFSAEGLVAEETRIDSIDGVDCSVYPYLDLPGDWETYLARHMGSNARSRARQALRKVEAGDGLRITHASAETLGRDMDILLNFWAARWGNVLSARVAGPFMQNCRNMLARCFPHGAVDLSVLWRDETPIGAVANLIDRRKMALLGLLCVRDMAVKNPSPAFTLIVHAIRRAIDAGFTRYDFLQGDHAYKFDYGPAVRRIVSHRITWNAQPIAAMVPRAPDHAPQLSYAEDESAAGGKALTKATRR